MKKLYPLGMATILILIILGIIQDQNRPKYKQKTAKEFAVVKTQVDQLMDEIIQGNQGFKLDKYTNPGAIYRISASLYNPSQDDYQHITQRVTALEKWKPIPAEADNELAYCYNHMYLLKIYNDKHKESYDNDSTKRLYLRLRWIYSDPC